MAGPLSAFTGDFQLHTKVANFIITPLDENGKIDESLGGARMLQYFPSEIETSHSANWQSKDIPGAPLPLYQWVSGGEHPFNLQAVFTRDMSGEIGKDVEEDKYNVDIDAAIAWLHLLSWNDYIEIGDSGATAIAPPVLYVHAEKTILGYNAIAAGALGEKNPGGVYCVLLEVGTTRNNWFKDGTVRMATVSLSFAEVMQIGQGIYPYGRSSFLNMAANYRRKP